MQPPSFLTKQVERKKLLLSIEVSITPTKTGRIGIHEGDVLEDIASIFCKTFQLNKQTEMSLVEQLQHHLRAYEKQKQKEEHDRQIKEQKKKLDKIEKEMNFDLNSENLEFHTAN